MAEEILRFIFIRVIRAIRGQKIPSGRVVARRRRKDVAGCRAEAGRRLVGPKPLNELKGIVGHSLILKCTASLPVQPLKNFEAMAIGWVDCAAFVGILPRFGDIFLQEK
jgi:hypothetical protein